MSNRNTRSLLRRILMSRPCSLRFYAGGELYRFRKYRYNTRTKQWSYKHCKDCEND